ncbi:unnamed protein product [Amoebophrya sp. A120]|nr:unnamed protein product [Amoebophrya sp. A120]|eukprot:GSA120T00005263001.1
MTSSASSSTASGSASSAAATAPRPATFSDLLVQSGAKRKNAEENKEETTGLEYNDWVSALEKAHSRNFEKQAVTAVVNAWQFCVFRGRALSTKIPFEVIGLVQEFIGPLASAKPSQQIVLNRGTLEEISDLERARGYKRAAEYFVKLAQEVAAKGGHCVEVTRGVHDSAPKMSDGTTPGLKQVFAVLDEMGFDLRDANDNTDVVNDDEFDFSTYPLLIEFNIGPALEDDAEQMKSYVRDLFVSHPSLARGRTHGGPNSRLARIFHEALIKAEDAAYQYVMRLVEETFARAEYRFVLTEAIYDGAPKLPNGQACPMFPDDVERVSGDQCEKTEVGIFVRLKRTDGIHVVCAEREHRFPITIDVLY